MDAIWEAISFGIRATWWLLRHTYIGYAELIQWSSARNEGYVVDFPLINVALSVVLTGFWLWWFLMAG